MPTIEGVYLEQLIRAGILFSLGSSVLGVFLETALPAGNYYNVLYTVGSDTIRVLNAITWRYVGTVPANIRLQTDDGVNAFTFHGQSAPVNSVYDNWYGQIIHFPGQGLAVNLGNATLNNDFEIYWSGYDILLNL